MLANIVRDDEEVNANYFELQVEVTVKVSCLCSTQGQRPRESFVSAIWTHFTI